MNLRPFSTLSEAEARREQAAREAARPVVRQVGGCLAVALVLIATWDYWGRWVTAGPSVTGSRPWAGRAGTSASFLADAAEPPARDSSTLVSRSSFGTSGISPLAEAPEKRSPHRIQP